MKKKIDGKLISSKVLEPIKTGYAVLYFRRYLIFGEIHDEHTKKRYYKVHSEALNYANKVKIKRRMEMVSIWHCDTQKIDTIM